VRTTPPLARLPAYPITGGVGLLATAITLLTASGRWDLGRFEMSPLAFTTEPWRLVTSALPHVLDLGRADFLHLPFNLYWLWRFGTLIEDVFGHVRALLLVVLLAAGSAAAEYALFHGGIGLSGVGYGLFGMLWYLAPRDRRFTGAVDARTTRLMVGWFFFCILATAAKLWAVANVAHGMGALLGLLVGAAIAARRPVMRVVAGAAIPALCAASFAGATTLRPKVNLAHDAHGSFQLGYKAIESGHFEDAVHHYRVAVATDPKYAAAWYNLGIAYEHVEKSDDALDAFRRAYEIDPSDTRHRAAYLGLCRHLGKVAQSRREHDKAVGYLQAAVAVDASDAETWLALAVSLNVLGRHDEAVAAREKASALIPPSP
jgi:membrane associated rhomboid family serine protease